jgi:hypothetical protein
MLRKIFLSICLLSLSLVAGDISVSDAYVRAVPPHLPNSASFMKIMNHSDKVVYFQRADSTLAKNLELHEHTMVNGMMKMQQVAHIEIPANGMVELQPGGYHVMLLGLNRPLKEGDIAQSIKLYFSNGEVLELKDVPVKNVMSGMKMKRMQN